MRKSKDVALVLGGGGARGIAHIGGIEVLEERGYNITSVAGTSMGALVGGIYAGGKLKELKDIILGLDKKQIRFLLWIFRWDLTMWQVESD
jgi:NTE family protein